MEYLRVIITASPVVTPLRWGCRYRIIRLHVSPLWLDGQAEVMVGQTAIVNRLLWMQDHYPVAADDVVAQKRRAF